MARNTPVWTPKRLEQLPSGKHRLGDCLYLLVYPSGTRSFLFRSTRGGTVEDLALGRYTVLTFSFQIGQSFDADGQLRSHTYPDGSQQTFSYNAAERLTQISTQEGQASAPTVSYRYDPYGRRISKTVAEGQTTKTTYYLNGDSALMAEADDDGKITKAYGFNPDTQAAGFDLWSTDPVWQADVSQGSLGHADTRYHYITTDHRGAPILATDRQGAKTWRGHAQAFGSTGIEAGSTASINLRLPGQYWDPETGLHQNYFRDYSPLRGRYLQSDPIGLWGGINTFAYVRGNPLGFADPKGLDTVFVINTNGFGHAGMVVGSGPGALLYDPGGSYRNRDKGSGDTLSGKDASLEEYMKYQRTDGPSVRAIRFPTTAEEESAIKKTIEDQGGCAPGQCAICVGNALNDLDRFKKRGGTPTPGVLGRKLDRILNPPPPSPFIPDTAWGWR